MNTQQRDIDSQIDYAVYKYGGNMPKSVAKAKAEQIANKAMLNYSKEKGSVKTYLSSHMQKLSRSAYKASSPVSIPESRLMSKGRVRNFSEEFHDTYGKQPSIQELSRGAGISLSDAKLHALEPSTYRTETAFENVAGSEYKDTYAVLDSLPKDIKELGSDIYRKGAKEKEIMKKHGLGRTTYFKKKKLVDSFIKSNSEESGLTFR